MKRVEFKELQKIVARLRTKEDFYGESDWESGCYDGKEMAREMAADDIESVLSKAVIERD